MLDPSIPLQFKYPHIENPLDQYKKGIQLSDLMSQRNLRQQQILQSQVQTQDLQAQAEARNKQIADTKTLQQAILDKKGDWGEALDSVRGQIDPATHLKISEAHQKDVAATAAAGVEQNKQQTEIFGQFDNWLQGLKNSKLDPDSKQQEYSNGIARFKANPSTSPFVQKALDANVLPQQYDEDAINRAHTVVVGQLGTLKEADAQQSALTSRATQLKDQQQTQNLQAELPGIQSDTRVKLNKEPLSEALTADQLADPNHLTDEQRQQQKNAEKAQATAAGHLYVAQQEQSLRAAKQNMEIGPQTVQTWVDVLKKNPDAVKEVPAALHSSVATAFQNSTGLPMPTAANSTSAATEMAARNAIDNAAFIKKAIQNPEIQKRLGPILGRLGEFEQNLGTAAVGLSPEAQKLAQELRTRMRYFVFQEGKATLGGRLPQQLMEALEKSSASVHMDEPTLKGAVDGALGAANTSLDNIDRGRFGGQARPRVLRGLAPGKIYQGPNGHTLASDDDGKTFYNPQTGEKDEPK